MTPNPPEQFDSTATTLLEIENISSHHSLKYGGYSKRRPTIPYNTTVEPSNQPKLPRNLSTDAKKEEGPRIDTNYIIQGYQQRQGPTRKRSLTPSENHFFPLSTIPNALSSYQNKDMLQHSQIGISGLPLDFGYPYKANSLLGKLRQKYEEVQKEKVSNSKPPSPVLKAASPTGRVTPLSNLFGILSDSISLDTIKFVVYCLLWYASSAITNNIGKQILNQFRFPITLTWIQFGFVFLYCYGFANIVGLTKIKSPTMHILRETIPLAFFQILGHVFSSVATSHVPVSFVHTIKALSPLFTVLVYTFAFRVHYSSTVYYSLLPLTIGVMLACSSQSTSNFIGFLFAMGSTIIFVAQNVFSKKLLFNQDHGSERKKLDKLNLLFYSSSLAFILMTPMWVYYDGIHLFTEYVLPGQTHHIHSNPNNVVDKWTVVFSFFLNGTTHFAQNILAFSILAFTSPVTYSIASLVKRIFVIVASIIWFGQNTTLVQGIGIFLTFTGLHMYNKAKRDVDRKERKAQEAAEVILPIRRSESELDLKRS